MKASAINNTQPIADWQWHAHLDLDLIASPRGTVLKRCRHKGPLYVQKPFYPEGRELAHLYLLHPPGGLVTGDELAITVNAGVNSQSLITTPGAARIYRARDVADVVQKQKVQKQSVTIRVEENASVEWFPMETIVFDGANTELHTHVELADNSHFTAWEITCLGLPASDKPFNYGRLQQSYRISQNGLPLFIDRIDCNPQQPLWFQNSAGLQGRTVSGFFLAGPFVFEDTFGAREAGQSALSDSLRQQIDSLGLQQQLAVTWVNGFCMLRYLGESAFEAREAFASLWQLIRPKLNHRQAKAPGIWKT